MNTNIRIALQYFRRKKMQTVLLALMITTTMLMVSSSFILINAYQTGDKIFESLNASESIIISNAEDKKVNSFVDFLNNQDEVENSFSEICYTPASTIMLTRLDQQILGIFQPYNQNLEYNRIQVVEGVNTLAPSSNQVFIPTGFAKTSGIELGDTLKFIVDGKNIELEVAAFVLDAHYSSGMLQPSILYISESLFNTFEGNAHKISIKYKVYTAETELDLMNKMDTYTDNTPIGLNIDHETFLSSYLGMSSILSTILVAVGTILLIISLLVISNAITTAIDEEYKTIGILKAFGFKRLRILKIYSIRYLFISIICIPFALIISLFISKIISNSLTDIYGHINESVSGLMPTLVASIIIVVIIFIATVLLSYKTTRIKPVQAIKYGSSERKLTKSRFNVSRSKLPIISSLSIKDLLMKKKSSLSMLITLCLATYIIVLCAITNTTFQDIGVIKELMGMAKSDIQVSQVQTSENMNHSDFLTTLNTIEGVNVAYSSITLTASSRYDPTYDREVYFIGTSYSTFKGVEYPFLWGEAPTTKNEIALSYKVTQIYQKDVGDYIEINVEGYKKSFLITGIYQSLNNRGESFLILDSALPSENYSSIGFIRSTFVIQDDNANTEIVKNNIQKAFGASVKIENQNMMFTMFQNISKSVTSTIYALIVILIGLIFIIVFNRVMIQVRNDSKKIGIYKAFGFSVNKIKIIYVNKNLIIALLSCLIGSITSILTASEVISKVTKSSLGIYRIPSTIPINELIIINVAILVCMIIATWFSTSRIKKLNPRSLLVE